MKRFLNSLGLFRKAFIATRREVSASLSILLFATVLFTVIMWIAESRSNEEFSLGDAFVWIIAKYVDDPADITTPPVTLLGQFVGTMVGILGIAIFAVPAGLVGSGLLDAMEDDKRNESTAKNSKLLHKRFRRIAQSSSWFYNDKKLKETYKCTPRYRSLAHVLVKTGMTNDEIVAAVNNCPDMRLMNLATTQRNDEQPQDRLVVVHFPLNNEYGCCIDRSSNVTIVAPVAVSEPGTGHFAFSLAAMGGFNYVSKELTPNPDDPFGFYSMQKSKLSLIGDEDTKVDVQSQALHFIDDLTQLKEKSAARGERHWFIFIMGTVKSTQCQVHLWRLATDKNKKMANRITKKVEYGSTVLGNDEEKLQNIFSSIAGALGAREVTIKEQKRAIAVDMDNVDILKSLGPSNIMCRMGGGVDCNALTIRLGYEILVYHSTGLLIAKDIADAIKSQTEPEREIPAEAKRCFLEEGDSYADEYCRCDVFEQEPEKLKRLIAQKSKEARKRFGNKELS